MPNLREITGAEGGNTLFELDTVMNYMPSEHWQENFDIDDERDVMPPIPAVLQDKEFELDENFDIMPRE